MFFVQFPHPGSEHLPRADDMPWNVGDHRRKFLISHGRYVDANGMPVEDELVFWGEWEPPSRIDRRWPPSERLPRALHRPYWISPTVTGFRQNTDPWVWGKHMIYSNCKQIVGPERNATSMQRLTPGSLICFGSTIGDSFCVDTVLVIASAERWAPVNARSMNLSDAFITCTADSVATRPTDARLNLTLYRGATFENQINGMYSFAPALMADHPSQRFARPSIALPGLINPASRQSTWGSKRSRQVDDVSKAWRAAVEQVFGAGLVLGVSFRDPDFVGTSHAAPSRPRARC